ncbi:MAG: helix-turn-helix domain-containing protein [Bacteroidota bacterium]
MEHQLSEQAELAAKYVNTTNSNIFLTGKAGTGKTTFLKYIVQHTFKNTVIAAPTGIAAINAGGVTLHSLLQLPFGAYIPEHINLDHTELGDRLNTPKTVFANYRLNKQKRQLIQEIELLIIDEVSMLRADLLDCIDRILRGARKKQEPFGGVQILFIGDLLQLPPVVKEAELKYLSKYYSSTHFFAAQVIRQSPLVHIELSKIYRQSDEVFVDLLNRLRSNKMSASDVAHLNSHHQKDTSGFLEKQYIYITTHNHKADKINQDALSNLKAETATYEADITNDFPESMYPTQPSLALKEGAQVMFIKNDTSADKKYFNGKIGKVISLEGDAMLVRCEGNEEDIEVEKHLWENKRYKLDPETNEIDERTIGSFKQFPVRLAWAITVHKSQGLTFDKAILDLSGTFAPGQMYVALSRLRSLDGLVLSSPIPNTALHTEDEVLTFAENRQSTDSLQNELSSNQKQYILQLAQSAFNFAPIQRELHDHLKGFDKDENRSIKQQYLPWTKELIEETGKLREVGGKFYKQILSIANSNTEYLTLLGDRLLKAQTYFSDQISTLQQRIATHFKEVSKQTKVKTYLKEIKAIESLYHKQGKSILTIQLLVQEAVHGRILDKSLVKSNSSDVDRPKLEKAPKTPTAEVSFGLYKAGKSIEEIAEERSLTPGTISGHLAQYIATGEIKATELIDEEKLNNIVTVAETIKSHSLGEIKYRLGDEYGYEDIKIAMAHLRHVNASEKTDKEED